MSDDHKKRHPIKLIQYANGPSLEEINGTVEVPHGKGFGARFLLIPGQGRWLPLVTWIPGIGQRPSQVGKTSSTY